MTILLRKSFILFCVCIAGEDPYSMYNSKRHNIRVKNKTHKSSRRSPPQFKEVPKISSSGFVANTASDVLNDQGNFRTFHGRSYESDYFIDDRRSNANEDNGREEPLVVSSKQRKQKPVLKRNLSKKSISVGEANLEYHDVPPISLGKAHSTSGSSRNALSWLMASAKDLRKNRRSKKTPSHYHSNETGSSYEHDKISSQRVASIRRLQTFQYETNDQLETAFDEAKEYMDRKEIIRKAYVRLSTRIMVFFIVVGGSYLLIMNWLYESDTVCDTFYSSNIEAIDLLEQTFNYNVVSETVIFSLTSSSNIVSCLPSEAMNIILERKGLEADEVTEIIINPIGLQQISSEAFIGERLKKVETIRISGNPIQVIQDNTFSPLISLEVLELNENAFVRVDANIFGDVQEPKNVSFARNSGLIEFPQAFRFLKSVNIIDVRGCPSMVLLRPGLLLNVEVETLELADNQLLRLYDNEAENIKNELGMTTVLNQFDFV